MPKRHRFDSLRASSARSSSGTSSRRFLGPVLPRAASLLGVLHPTPGSSSSREQGRRTHDRARRAILGGVLVACSITGLVALARRSEAPAPKPGSPAPMQAESPQWEPSSVGAPRDASPAVPLQDAAPRDTVRSSAAVSGSLTEDLRAALIELGSMELDSPQALEERTLAVVTPLERLEQVGLALCSGLLIEREDALAPIERGALRGLVLGVHLHRASPPSVGSHARGGALGGVLGGAAGGMPAGGTPRSGSPEAGSLPQEGSAAPSEPLAQGAAEAVAVAARVEALLERCLLAAPAWSEAQRERFAQLASSLRSRGQCCVGPQHAPTLLKLRSEEPWLGPWCDTLLACGLSRASAEEREAVSRAWLAAEPDASAAGATLSTLFESGDLQQAWSLTELLWARLEHDAEGRAAVLGAVAAKAPLPDAILWLEERATAGDVGVGLALSGRPGAEQAALERYGELLLGEGESRGPVESRGPSAPEGMEARATSDLHAQRRRVLVGAMTDPGLLTDLACTDPSPLVRGHAHLTAAQRARPSELSRLVAELERESVGAQEGALSPDLRAVIAVTHARRAQQVGSERARRAAQEQAQALLASGDLSPSTRSWLLGALEAWD